MKDASLDHPPLEGLRRGQSLARYTAARLGGPADYLYVAKDPSYRDVQRLLQWAWKRGLPVTVLGGGANVLVSDTGIRGLTIINRAAQIERLAALNLPRVVASAGTSMIHLARFCQQHGLSGLEWMIAVPGTVGGAVVNNAGAHDGDIAGALRRALLYKGHGERWVDANELDYAYRHSRLKQLNDRRFFVMRAEFELARDEPATIQARMERNNAYRRRTQPPGASLGSIFKNPPGDFAGRLIEQAGLKGARIGAVCVSPIHANFFVNEAENASARHYFALIQLVQNKVEQEHGIRLELEIQTLGAWQ